MRRRDHFRRSTGHMRLDSQLGFVQDCLCLERDYWSPRYVVRSHSHHRKSDCLGRGVYHGFPDNGRRHDGRLGR